MKIANPNDTVYICLKNAWNDWKTNEDLMGEWIYFRTYIKHGCGFTYSEAVQTPIGVIGSHSKDRSMTYEVLNEKLFSWFLLKYTG
jgi:hypothetical protein